jgi:hypothetical protein
VNLVVHKKLPRQRRGVCGRQNARSGREIGQDEKTEDGACRGTEVEDDASAEEGSKDLSPLVAKNLQEGRQDTSRERGLHEAG